MSTDIKLTPCQEGALAAAIDLQREHGMKMLAIAGPAGTGKTTLVKMIVEALACEFANVQLCSVSHKAVGVLSTLSGREASTLQSLMHLRPKPNLETGDVDLVSHRAPDFFEGGYLVVDEASMVNDDLFGRLQSWANRDRMKVLFIGDPYQLPPPSEDDCPVFREVPIINLDQIVRQAASNPVISYAEQFRLYQDGGPAPVLPEQTEQLRMLDRAAFGIEFAQAVKEGRDVKAVAWTNDRVLELMEIARRARTGPQDSTHFVGDTYVANDVIQDRVGDLMCLNNGEVTILKVTKSEVNFTGSDYPGEQLRVLNEDGGEFDIFVPDNWGHVKSLRNALVKRAKALEIEIDKSGADPERFLSLGEEKSKIWELYYETKDVFVDIRSTIASTVHKAQGETYREVFIDAENIAQCRDPKQYARLLYVALTRTSDRAILCRGTS
jgi:exodeoxyribonuclease V